MKLMNPQLLLIITVIVGLGLTACSGLLDPDEPGNLVPKTVVEDPDLPRIEVNGTVLHAEAFGNIENPIMIFLHGGPGSDYRAFISQIGEENASRYPDERTIINGGLSQLQDSFYCVFYDQRGAGLSPRFDKGVVDFDMYIEDLDAIIDHYLQAQNYQTGLTANQVYLMGWSYGGILATGYINRYPDRVKDAIFYESGPISIEIWEYFRDNSTSIFEQIGEDYIAEYALSHDHITPDTHERADYQLILGATKFQPDFHQHPGSPMWRHGVFIGGENLDFRESESYDITSNLSAFEGRLLLMAGELTREEYPEYDDLYMPYYPRSEYAEVAGVGHTGVWEKPEEVAAVIRDFLNQ